MKIRILSLAAAALLALAACSSPAGSSSAEIPSVAVSSPNRAYMAGFTSTTAPDIRACYWVDGTRTLIADAGLGFATRATAVVPTNLGDYVVGIRTDLVGSTLVERAVVWFGGKGGYLDDAPSHAYAAVLSGGKLLVAGWRRAEGDPQIPCCWEVSDAWTLAEGAYAVSSRKIARRDLPTNGGDGEARDIAAEGSDVYVVGSCDDGGLKVCCWKNGERTDLAGGTDAIALDVDAGKVYVAGSSAAGACYWEDGARTDLSGFPAGASHGIATAIAAGDGGLLLGGMYTKSFQDYGFLVQSGSLTAPFPLSTRVSGVGRSGADTYVGVDSGWYRNGAYSALPLVDGRNITVVRLQVY